MLNIDRFISELKIAAVPTRCLIFYPNINKVELMLSYPFQSLLAVIIFSLVHLFANLARKLDTNFHRRFLSIGSGIAIAYVFIDILPKLSKHEPMVNQAIWRFFPYFEKHVYIMALMGFLLFFIVDRSATVLKHYPSRFYLSLSSYILLNILIGYAVADIDNPEVRPLILFTIAMALHYFVNDYSLTENFKAQYDHFAKWMLIAALFLGWATGLLFELPEAGVALISAFIGGGVIMNVTRHELPDEHQGSLASFLLATAFYSLTLLMLG